MMTSSVIADNADYISDLERAKCPVSGLRQYVYDYLRGVVRPESEAQAGYFEVGDAVVGGYDVARKTHLVRLVNEIADTLGVSETVDFLGDIQAWDRKKAQKDALILALDRIAERASEAPDALNMLPGWMAYDAWADDQALLGMLEAHNMTLETSPCVDLAVPDVQMPEPLTVDVPCVAIEPVVYARPRRKTVRRKTVKYEPARRGIRRSCANLGYEDDGMLWCMEHDRRATPARCRSCKAYCREDS